MIEKMKSNNKSRPKKTTFIVLGVVVIIAILGIITYSSIALRGNTTSLKTEPVKPSQNDTTISIPISELSTTTKFYEYDASGVTIRYFAVKDSKGDIHVAMDACDVCYEAKKGYKQNGDVMHCINCGREFSIMSIGTDNTAGGCWPSYLPMNIEGNNVLIKITDIEAKKYMF